VRLAGFWIPNLHKQKRQADDAPLAAHLLKPRTQLEHQQQTPDVFPVPLHIFPNWKF